MLRLYLGLIVPVDTQPIWCHLCHLIWWQTLSNLNKIVSNHSVVPDCLSPPGSSLHVIFPSKNTGVGCHAFLQRIFPTQGLKPGLPPCRQILYQLSHQGSPRLKVLPLNYLKCPAEDFLSPDVSLSLPPTFISADPLFSIFSKTSVYSLSTPLGHLLYYFLGSNTCLGDYFGRNNI